MKKIIGAFGVLSLVLAALASEGQAAPQVKDPLKDAQNLYSSGQYFKAARYAFDAIEEKPGAKSEAYSWITLSLIKAGLPNSASYFFIRTLQMDDRHAIRRVLTETESLLVRVGADVLRKYLVRHTKYEDYDIRNRSAYLYSLAKESLLSGNESQAIGYLNGIESKSALWPIALQMRGTAQAISGKTQAALADFQQCQRRAELIVGDTEGPRLKLLEKEAEDLKYRCIAGEARTLYQMDKLDEADQVYDRISKQSFVWPDILFEQAWNAFGRNEYNRALGRLVSYKSPALSFVFNSEVDVLRAQSFLTLCLYDDANRVINEFNEKYSKLGIKVKEFVENRTSDPVLFYGVGKEALLSNVYTKNEFHRLLNRFIRGPYFQNLVAFEGEIRTEARAIRQFAALHKGIRREESGGFPGFLDLVLKWRLRSVQLLGGVFVKNSLMDYHAALISDFEKMAFIKLEMLKQAKEKLLGVNPEVLSSSSRERGTLEPKRRGYQYYWSFNGEFWNDELGDYVFGLESQCK